MNYKVYAKITQDGKIIQSRSLENESCFGDPLGLERHEIMRQVIDTQEAQVREALIKLGWTPPFTERRMKALTKTYGRSDDARIRALERRKA